MTPLSWATWAISRLCSWLCGAYSRKNHPQWRCLNGKIIPKWNLLGIFSSLLFAFLLSLGAEEASCVNIMISLIRTFIPIKVVLQSISYITTSCPCCWYIILGFSCLLFCKFCHWHIKHHQVGILYLSVISTVISRQSTASQLCLRCSYLSAFYALGSGAVRLRV